MHVGMGCLLRGTPPLINICAYRTQGFSRCSHTLLPTHCPFRTLLPSLGRVGHTYGPLLWVRVPGGGGQELEEGADTGSVDRMNCWKVFIRC